MCVICFEFFLDSLPDEYFVPCFIRVDGLHAQDTLSSYTGKCGSLSDHWGKSTIFSPDLQKMSEELNAITGHVQVAQIWKAWMNKTKPELNLALSHLTSLLLNLTVIIF